MRRVCGGGGSAVSCGGGNGAGCGLRGLAFPAGDARRGEGRSRSKSRSSSKTKTRSKARTKTRSKTNSRIKGSGQECPLYTGLLAEKWTGSVAERVVAAVPDPTRRSGSGASGAGGIAGRATRPAAAAGSGGTWLGPGNISRANLPEGGASTRCVAAGCDHRGIHGGSVWRRGCLVWALHNFSGRAGFCFASRAPSPGSSMDRMCTGLV